MDKLTECSPPTPLRLSSGFVRDTETAEFLSEFIPRFPPSVHSGQKGENASLREIAVVVQKSWFAPSLE